MLRWSDLQRISQLELTPDSVTGLASMSVGLRITIRPFPATATSFWTGRLPRAHCATKGYAVIYYVSRVVLYYFSVLAYIMEV